MRTRTGGFPIGFIRGGLGQDGPAEIGDVIDWARDNGLEAIDSIEPEDVPAALDAGLRIGTISMTDTRCLISQDQARRERAVAANVELIRANAAFGPLNYMVVMVPEDPGLPRTDNFGYMVKSYEELTPVLEECQARVSIEGWPGPGALCCTPETLRAFFEACPSSALGINFDPSHLVRMGIDPSRFLEEFGRRVIHIHGKDTELLIEGLYEFGREQPATFASAVAFGGTHWRYAIPGHGMVRWCRLFEALAGVRYAGCVCIELEDANFVANAEERQLGILLGARFLAGC